MIVDRDKYYTRFGQTGGAIQESVPTICQGKNPGKAHATTPEEQAMLEAKAQWEKKLKKDYVKTQAEAVAGAKSELIEGGLLPMLAHKFSEHGDKIAYPCFVQPKLDGHRCVGMADGLWSRTRKAITGVPHILDAVREIEFPYPADGELYTHDYRDRFEDLSHFIRQKTPDGGHEIVQYHVYDMVAPDLPFSARIAVLQNLLSAGGGPVKLVETVEAANEDELMLAFERFLLAGYEGAIVRNAAGLYVNKRSYDLLKLKEFDDGEFEIMGVNEGKGKLAAHGIFVCKTKDGAVFEAKMKGALSDLQKFFQHPERYKGKQLTVQYQGFTNKNRVPRFPVALRVCE